MVHAFTCLDKHFIYDSGSGSLHECDAKTCGYVAAKYEGTGGLSSFSAAETAEIERELGELERQGLFLAPEEKVCPPKSSEVKALCLHICHDCNLRCRYCFADEGAYHSSREFMDEKTAMAAIDFLIAASGNRKTLEVDFFGGEPLMCLPTIKNVVAYARKKSAAAGKNILFTTTTNALLLDGDATDFFNREMENVVLSLDGRKEVHDAIRKTVNGKGSFDAVFGKIKKFVEARGDKNYYVRGTFTAKNLDFSNDVMFLAESGFKNISMEPVVTDIGDLAIKEEHLARINAEYETLLGKYLQKYDEGDGFGFFHFNVDLEGGTCLQKRISACGAGNEYFSVVPGGDLYPCHQFAGDKNFLMGNVFTGEINPAVRSRFAESCLFTRKGCENCFARFICSGGCAANNYHFCGDINLPYGVTCSMMKKRIECGMYAYAHKKEVKKG